MAKLSRFLQELSSRPAVLKIVVDTNVLLTFFWGKSVSKKILPKREFEFFSPVLALEEINSHKAELLEKTGLSEEEFKKIREELAIYVEFIPVEELLPFLQKASCIPDKDDVEFIALSLKFECALWSNDKALKKQSLVEVFTTSEFIKKALYSSDPSLP